MKTDDKESTTFSDAGDDKSDTEGDADREYCIVKVEETSRPTSCSDIGMIKGTTMDEINGGG